MHFLHVARAVMVAHDRRRRHGIADLDRAEEQVHIHHDAERRHAVLAGIAQELDVVHDRYHRRADVSEEFRHAVPAGVEEYPRLETGLFR